MTGRCGRRDYLNGNVKRCLTARPPLRQVTPGHARPVAIDDGIDEQAVVGRRTADVALAAGQKSLIFVHWLSRKA